jgi:hypothetical protein
LTSEEPEIASAVNPTDRIESSARNISGGGYTLCAINTLRIDGVATADPSPCA